MKLAQIEVITDGGPWAIHNMPCAVCGDKQAILQLWDGKFQPCRDCQKTGWILINRKKESVFVRIGLWIRGHSI